MGMEQTVTFSASAMPTWAAVSSFLTSHGYPTQVRMLDGQLALPGEMPPDDWQELRIGTTQGMVTLRCSRDTVVFVTWGNADAGLRQAWNALAWAYAEIGGGTVQTPEGVLEAAAFRRQADLPSGLGPSG